MQNLAASGLRAILDPAGPIPYRFEPDELAALAAGVFPGTRDPIFASSGGTSLWLRAPGPEADAVEPVLREALARTAVRAAYLAESTTDGARRLLVGLSGDESAVGTALPAVRAAAERVTVAVDVVGLEEPMLSELRRLGEPFYRAAHRR